jgi:micrococcal nuclease
MHTRVFLILFFFSFLSRQSFAELHTVKKVIDGDTIQLSGKQIVHLIGIDAPEDTANEKAMIMAKRRDMKVKDIIAVGGEATQYLRDLLSGREVWLEFVDTKENENGEWWVYVFLGYSNAEDFPESDNTYFVHTSGGTFLFVNASMIKAGYAVPFNVPPNHTYAELFRKLFQDARANKRGLWE